MKLNINVYLFVYAVILIFFVCAYYYFTRPKERGPVESYNEYCLRTTSTPQAFTYARLNDGRYINYYREEANLKVEYEDFPVKLDGIPYKYDDEHGEITDTDKGFRIRGISIEFQCPDLWTWNVQDRLCEPQAICDDEGGFIKGIDMYQFAELPHDENIKFHERVYAICGKGNEFVTGRCENNYIYNQKYKQSAIEEPCEPYDVCMENPNNTKHRWRKSNEDPPLKDNEYYVCKNGKSELYSCEPPLYFSELYESCIEAGKCYGKADGYTFPLNASSYIQCKNNDEYIIRCPAGIYDVDGPTNLKCINTECKSDKILKYFSNDYFTVPQLVKYCVDNLPTGELNCETNKTNVIVFPIPLSNVYRKAKTNFYVDNVEYPERVAETIGENGKYECVPLTNDNLSKYKATDHANVSYNEDLASVFWDFINNWAVLDYGIYFNVNGKITSIKDREPIDDMIKYIPFMYGGDKWIRIKSEHITRSIKSDEHGLNFQLLFGLSSDEKKQRNMYHSYSLRKLIVDNDNITYRMIIYNFEEEEFITVDISSELIDEQWVIVGNPPRHANNLDIGGSIEHACIVGGINAYGYYADVNNIAFYVHWLTFIKVNVYESLNGKLKYITSTNDDSNLTSQQMIEKIIDSDSIPPSVEFDTEIHEKLNKCLPRSLPDFLEEYSPKM